MVRATVKRPATLCIVFLTRPAHRLEHLATEEIWSYPVRPTGYYTVCLQVISRITFTPQWLVMRRFLLLPLRRSVGVQMGSCPVRSAVSLVGAWGRPPPIRIFPLPRWILVPKPLLFLRSPPRSRFVMDRTRRSGHRRTSNACPTAMSYSPTRLFFAPASCQRSSGGHCT